MHTQLGREGPGDSEGRVGREGRVGPVFICLPLLGTQGEVGGVSERVLAKSLRFYSF